MNASIWVFPFWNWLLHFLNLLNYFATSICKYVIQVVISTGTVKIFAWVFISISYLYLKTRPIFKKKRKSSCVNARGILPTTYQVLHMLSYPGGTPIPHPWMGYPIPGQGVPTSLVGGTPCWELARVTPSWDLARVPPLGLGQGYPPLRLGQGYPIGTWPGGIPLSGLAGGYPHQDFARGYPPIGTWPGGTPHLDLTWLGGTPRVDKQTNRNYYLPPSYGCGR